MTGSSISGRKNQHIDIVRHQDVGFHQTTTLLEEVQLVHEALPDLALEDIDLTQQVLGKPLRAPILIAAMTGGSAEAAAVNRDLAAIAQQRGYGFGLGSQRAMLRHPDMTRSYQVRQVAPDALVLGNIGMVQARAMSEQQLQDMVQAVGADALCVHLNAAMELVQPEGDRDFRGGLETLRRVTAGLGVPVVAKETGCGLSRATAQRLRSAGVQHVDVSAAGGTSWTAVESLRASGAGRRLGEALREWGIPTAASVLAVRAAGMTTTIATGGIRTGLDVARALVLGADAAGLAGAVIREWGNGGAQAVDQYLDEVERELRSVMLLVGARTLQDLRQVPRLLGPRLSAWARLWG